MRWDETRALQAVGNKAVAGNSRRCTMKIDIHYCTEWNYKPNAVSLADELRKAFSVEAKLVPGRNGIFDVIVDGELAFSKFKVGRFPEPGEVAGKLKQ